MERKLPGIEDSLPIYEINGKFLTLEELKESFPAIYEQLTSSQLDTVKAVSTVSTNLLAKRFAMRIEKGEVFTIYSIRSSLDSELSSLTPQQQLYHVGLRDEEGIRILTAEYKLLEAELKILKGDYGNI